MSEVTWWRNGDHPDDRIGELRGDPAHPFRRVEGAVVRFYRHPWTPGNKRHLGSDVTGERGCGHRWHDHGWIDQGEDGITVCPGDTVVTEDDGTYSVKRGIDMNEIPSLGQVAFEAYRAEVQGVAYDGSGIPPWDSLDGDRAKAQRGWEAAAQAVRQHVLMIAALDVAQDRRVRDFREGRGSRWEPLSAPVAPVDPEFPAPLPRAPQASAQRAAAAQESVPVVADDEG